MFCPTKPSIWGIPHLWKTPYVSMKWSNVPFWSQEYQQTQQTCGRWQDPAVTPPRSLHAMAPCKQKGSPPSPDPHGLVDSNDGPGDDNTAMEIDGKIDGNRRYWNCCANQIQSAGDLSVSDWLPGVAFSERGTRSPDVSRKETQWRFTHEVSQKKGCCGTQKHRQDLRCDSYVEWKVPLNEDHNSNKNASSDMQGLQSGSTGTL